MASVAEPADAGKALRTALGITPNSQRYKFLHYLENVGIPLLLVKTILAPIERWRIIRQTWNSYVTNSRPYGGVVDYFQSMCDMSIHRSCQKSRSLVFVERKHCQLSHVSGAVDVPVWVL